jgi:EmrB/QacA subfamily drug resistance transporter
MKQRTVTSLPQQLGIIFSGSFAGFMAMLDNNIINISLPYIAKYFGIGTSVVVQISLVYFLMLAGTIILFGKLADKFGVKKIFVTGFTIFTISSLLCGLSPTFHVLLIARAFQGIGGSMLYSTAISLITIYIPAEKRGWAFGIFTPINSLGMLIGSPLGGLITGLLSWHWIFLVNVPVGIVAVFVALRQIPADPPRDEKQKKEKFDIAGTLLSFTGLVVLVYLLNQGRHLGFGSPMFIGGMGFVILALTAFILLERRVKEPLLDLSIFSDKNFSLSLLASLLAVGMLAGTGILMPFYLTYILKINLELSGFVLMISPVVFSGLSMVIGSLSDRVSRTRLTIIGMSLGIVAATTFIILIPGISLIYVVLYAMLQGIAYAFFITPNNNLVMSLAPADKQSVSSSVFRLSSNLGQITGILVMESMFTLSFPSGMHVTNQILKTMSTDILISGFRFAYLGGALLCMVALMLSIFVKDSGNKTAPEEPAFGG